jgi:hypothetical protein
MTTANAIWVRACGSRGASSTPLGLGLSSGELDCRGSFFARPGALKRKRPEEVQDRAQRLVQRCGAGVHAAQPQNSCASSAGYRSANAAIEKGRSRWTGQEGCCAKPLTSRHPFLFRPIPQAPPPPQKQERPRNDQRYHTSAGSRCQRCPRRVGRPCVVSTFLCGRPAP